MILTTLIWGIIGAGIASMWGFTASVLGSGFTIGVILHIVLAVIVKVYGWDR